MSVAAPVLASLRARATEDLNLLFGLVDVLLTLFLREVLFFSLVFLKEEDVCGSQTTFRRLFFFFFFFEDTSCLPPTRRLMPPVS